MIWGFFTLLCLLALVFFGRKAGRDGAENEERKQVLDDIRKANDARAGLERDAAAAKRVRDIFTR
jgi:hypothetical protein